MAERLPKTNVPPSWLSLESYDGARILSAAGWYEQLLLRRTLLRDVRSTNWKSKQPEGVGEIKQEVQGVLNIVQNAPVTNISSNKLLSNYLYGLVRPARGQAHPHLSSGVRPATIEDLYMTEGLCLDDTERADARDYFDWLFNRKGASLKLKYRQWFDRPVDDLADHIGDEVLVRVNMALPDSLLKEQFRLMLKSLRSSRDDSHASFRIGIRKPEYQRWINFRVLPYIDLKIWEYANGKRLTNPAKVKLLFSDMDRTSEDVRKTVDRLSKEALSRGNLLILSALATQDQAKGKST